MRPSSAGSTRSAAKDRPKSVKVAAEGKSSEKNAKIGSERGDVDEDSSKPKVNRRRRSLTAPGLTHGAPARQDAQLSAAQLLQELQEPFLKRFAAEMEQAEKQHKESNDRLRGLVGMQMEILGRMIMEAEENKEEPVDTGADFGQAKTFDPNRKTTGRVAPIKRACSADLYNDKSSATTAPIKVAPQYESSRSGKKTVPAASVAFKSVVATETLRTPDVQRSGVNSGDATSENKDGEDDEDSIIFQDNAHSSENSNLNGTEASLEDVSPSGQIDLEDDSVTQLKTEEATRASCELAQSLPIPGSAFAVEDNGQHDLRSSEVSGVSGVSEVPPLPTLGGRHSLGSDTGDRDSALLTFEILPIWKKKRKSTLNRLWKKSWQNEDFDNREFARGMSFVRLSGKDDDDETSVWRQCFNRYIMIKPNSKGRVTWDLTALFLVMYDAVSIPLSFFDPPETLFGNTMNWITRFFWSLDMPLAFITAYIRTDGATEIHLENIAKRYIKSWLLPDIIVVGSDWLELLMSVGSGLEYARLGKASRFFRILRLIRLMRLIKMGQVVRLFQERIFSEILVIGMEVVKSMIIILSFEHLCACIWYGIGARTSVEMSWVKYVDAKFHEEDLGPRYFASLHWSLSQLGGGMDEIAPKNYEERFTAIIIYLVSFIIAAIFVSSLTSSMTRLVILGSQQSQQLSGLRRYLLLNGISNGLMLRIQRNANYALSERQKFMPEGGVELLNVISEPLRVELHFEIYSSVLMVHPFFHRYIEECPQVLRKVCHAGISVTEVSHGDVLFTVGEIPARPKMYFQRSGQLQYVAITGRVSEISNKMWLSEAVLWCSWMHRGQLTAATDTRMIMLDAHTFQDMASEFDHHDFDPKVYAAEFVTRLNNMASMEISDLPFGAADGTDYASLKRASFLSWSGANSLQKK